MLCDQPTQARKWRPYKMLAYGSITSIHIGHMFIKILKSDGIILPVLSKWDNAFHSKTKIQTDKKSKNWTAELKSRFILTRIFTLGLKWCVSRETAILYCPLTPEMAVWSWTVYWVLLRGRFNVNRKASTNPRERVPIAKDSLSTELSDKSLYTSNSSLEIKPSFTWYCIFKFSCLLCIMASYVFVKQLRV